MSFARHRTLRAVAVGSVVLSLAGCGGSGPSPEAIDWVDGVCSSMRPFAEHIAAGPQIEGADADAALAGLGRFLDGGATSLDSTLARLAAIGPSPVTGGDGIVERMTASYTQQALREASTRLAAVDPADDAALADALPAALEGLPASFDPTAELRGDPAVASAVEASAVCQTLPATAG